jgi:predicted dehydrogenase
MFRSGVLSAGRISNANGISVRGSRATAFASPGTPEAVVIEEEIAGPLVETHVHRRGWNAGYGVEGHLSRSAQGLRRSRDRRREPLVTAESATRALRVIERAYSVRQPLPQPWLTPEVA